MERELYSVNLDDEPTLIKEVTLGLSYRDLKLAGQTTPIPQKHSPINMPYQLCLALQRIREKRRKRKKNRTGTLKPQLSLLERTALPQEQYMELLSVPNAAIKKKRRRKTKKVCCKCKLTPLCRPRLIQMSLPKKRYVWENWKAYQNFLPAEILMRFDQILRSGQNLDLEIARCYFKRLEKQRKRELKKKKKLLMKKKKELKKGETRWIKEEIHKTVDAIISNIENEPAYVLNFQQMMISNELLRFFNSKKILKVKKRTTKDVYKKTLIEISDNLIKLIDKAYIQSDLQPLNSKEKFEVVVEVPSVESVIEEEIEEIEEGERIKGEEEVKVEMEEIGGMEQEGIIQDEKKIIPGELTDEQFEAVKIIDKKSEFEKSEDEEEGSFEESLLDVDILELLIQILSESPSDFLMQEVDPENMPGVTYLDILIKLKELHESQELLKEGEPAILAEKIIDWAKHNDPQRTDKRVEKKIKETATILASLFKYMKDEEYSEYFAEEEEEKGGIRQEEEGEAGAIHGETEDEESERIHSEGEGEEGEGGKILGEEEGEEGEDGRVHVEGEEGEDERVHGEEGEDMIGQEEESEGGRHRDEEEEGVTDHEEEGEDEKRRGEEEEGITDQEEEEGEDEKRRGEGEEGEEDEGKIGLEEGEEDEGKVGLEEGEEDEGKTGLEEGEEDKDSIGFGEEDLLVLGEEEGEALLGFGEEDQGEEESLIFAEGEESEEEGEEGKFIKPADEEAKTAEEEMLPGELEDLLTIIKGHKPSVVVEHTPGTICCLSLKIWAVWLLEIAENAHNWTKWIVDIIKQVRHYAAVIRGDVTSPSGGKQLLYKQEWRKFVEDTEQKIIAWRQYSAHVKDLSNEIMENFHGKKVNCCPKCLQDHLIKNVVTAHETLKALTEAINCASYWQRCLDRIVEQTSKFTEIEAGEIESEKESSEESYSVIEIEELSNISRSSGESVMEIEELEIVGPSAPVFEILELDVNPNPKMYDVELLHEEVAPVEKPKTKKGKKKGKKR